MSIMRWDPFREAVGMRHAMDRLFDESFFRPLQLRERVDGGHYFPMDIYHTPEAVVARAVLPGLKPEDVEITIDRNVLTISGKSSGESDIKEESYLRREWHYGTFARTIALPEGLEGGKAEAVYENGVLTLTIPKAEEIRPKLIKVQAKGLAAGKAK
jgi:HSP20 family protein